jgi:hypothetical protein
MAGEPIQTDRSIRWPSTAGIKDQEAKRAIDALIIIVKRLADSAVVDLSNLRAEVDTLLAP